jgi:CheY-like chemotaxis protein
MTDILKDIMQFIEDEAREALFQNNDPWKVLVVDDENEVHEVTNIVLKKYTFKGQGLQFLNAHSGKEAKTIIDANPDIALVLLDVVMETDDAGLGVIKHIRETLKNQFLRIVLRTGQPGQAPEQSIITKYAIDDYKEKSELTMDKLYTCLTSSLRTYDMLLSYNKVAHMLKRELEKNKVLSELLKK